MKKIFLLTIILFGALVGLVSAEISYPVAELGNCANEKACETYCDDMAHIDSCLNFAEKNNLMTAAEIAEARKFAPLMKAGDTPGGCKNRRECDAFCNDEKNINLCVDFALKAGIIDAKEAEMVKKTGGKGPGGCKGKEECDVYCEDESHFSECVDFAVKYGMMDASEAEMVKKTGGKGPGGCKSKEACDAFCSDEKNMEICVQFAIEKGLMSEKDAEMMRKTGGKSPGNCKGKEECDAFCKNPSNMEICTNFAIEHGLMSPEEVEKMKEGLEWMKSEQGQCTMQCLGEAGVDVKECGENGEGPAACKECGNKCYTQEMKDAESGGCQDCERQCGQNEGQRLKGTDCIDNQCKCIYEQVEVERQEPTEQGGPVPEGEMAPGDYVAPVVVEEGSAPPSDGGSADSGSSGGEAPAVAVTGEAISEQEGRGIIDKIIDFLRNLF